MRDSLPSGVLLLCVSLVGACSSDGASPDAAADQRPSDLPSADLATDSAPPHPCGLTGTPPSGYTLGVPSFGKDELIVYVPGELPLIVATPHGGHKEGGLPVRDEAKAKACPSGEGYNIKNDSNSQELARAIVDAVIARTGRRPHLVVNDLARSRLDANRTLCVAATGEPRAEQAWREFHRFIDDAKAHVAARCGRGLYLDIHTHGHDTVWAELGVLLPATTLAEPDATLDGDATIAQASSLRGLAAASSEAFSTLLRGPQSFGSLLVAASGHAAVPSKELPHPAGKAYFSGGYNTYRHGSREKGGAIDAIQIESRFSMFDEAKERAAYADAIAQAALAFLEQHYGYSF